MAHLAVNFGPGPRELVVAANEVMESKSRIFPGNLHREEDMELKKHDPEIIPPPPKKLTCDTSFFFHILSYVAPPSHWGVRGALPSSMSLTASP